MGYVEIHVDGACSGNPGPAAVGVVIRQSGQVIKEISQAIGDGTNNIAEYTAFIYALQEALILRVAKVKIFTDSELVFSQLTGKYQVKDQKLKLLFEQVRKLCSGFSHVEIAHVPREQNKDADRLAVKALKQKQANAVASLFDHSGEESPSS